MPGSNTPPITGALCPSSSMGSSWPSFTGEPSAALAVGLPEVRVQSGSHLEPDIASLGGIDD